MRVVITGTHLSPAIAVARKFREQKYNVIFISRKYALEGDQALSLDYQTITKEGFEFKDLITGRLQRKWTRYTLPSLLKIPIGLFEALWILINFKPDVILSFGGYVSLPVTLMGFIFGIPVIIHEQTVGAGLSNRIGGLFAKKVLISWESSRKFFPKDKTILTGNPVREEIFSAKLADSIFNSKIKNKNLPMIYITGGSLGSHTINVTMEKIISRLLNDFVIIHQTGDARKYKDFERLSKLREQLEGKKRKRYFLIKHVEVGDLGWIFNNTSLVVSRAGANTVTELLALGKPALLIPLPFASGNEQMEHALLLKNTGLGEILPQDDLTTDKLFNKIKSMMGNLENYRKNKDAARALIKKGATQKILEVVLNEVSKKK